MPETAANTPRECADSFALPTAVYALATAWDPEPEINRLLHLSREAGVIPLNALELGCGGGRLLRAMRSRGIGATGIDLSPTMVAHARAVGLEAHVADMSDFDLQCSFDLIYASANTLRHVVDTAAWSRMWGCIARGLPPGGVFIADLELGVRHLRAAAGKPQVWTMSAGDASVRSTWTIVEPPSVSGVCRVEWTIEHEGSGTTAMYRIAFPLRCDDAVDFLSAAARAGLSPVGIFENRDPFLIPCSSDQAEGRMLVVLRKP